MRPPALVDLADLHAGDSPSKAAGALERYRLRLAISSQDPVFAAAFGLLNQYFGPLGEIEREAVLRGWADAPRRQLGPYTVQYSLILAEDESGSPAGARDGYAILDPERRVCVVYLAHALVRPEHRRTGLASLLRTAPATLGRALMAEHGAEDSALMLAVEQEAIHPTERDSHAPCPTVSRTFVISTRSAWPPAPCPCSRWSG